MNTIGKIGIALAVLMVAAALALPAVADYSGDHPLTIYEHGIVDGGLVYEAVTDGSGYTKLNAIDSATYSQNIAVNIPAGATVKLARLYNYYTWSKSDYGDKYTPGDPAEAALTFDGASVTCQNPASITNHIDYDNGVIQYWDSKGQGYFPPGETTYDFPSGTFAWDVTNLVIGSDTYTATITNADSSPTSGEYFTTFGFGLLVIYEDASSPTIEYWIAEGCDYLMAKTYENPEDATTSANFVGKGLTGERKVTLTTVLTASDKGTLDPPLNMVYFNGEEIGPSTAGGSKHIGVNEFEVGKLKENNIAEFQDRDDCEVVCNAFLVDRPVIPASVTFDKKKLNLNSNGILKAFITLPEPYDVANIDINAVTCEGASAELEGGGVIPGKGAFEAKFKIPELNVSTGDAVELTVEGELYDGTPFEGSNTLKVV